MQHLNLATQLDRVKEPLFSARQQAWIVSSLFVLMLAVYGVLAINSGSLQEKHDRLQREQDQQKTQLTDLQARKAKLERESTLDRELAQLKDEIQFRRRLLNNIDPNSAVLENGFADHLEGLGRQHIEGMWFTGIQLQQGGEQMALLGQTRAPEFVPRYIRKLASEPVFQGHQFRVFRMHIPEQQQLLAFELRADAEQGERR